MGQVISKDLVPWIFTGLVSRARLDIVGKVICILFGIVILKLTYVSLIKGNEYKAMG